MRRVLVSAVALFVSCTTANGVTTSVGEPATVISTSTVTASNNTTIAETSNDVFSLIQGWIVYRNAFELMAVDPLNPEDQRSLGPANNLQPLGWSADGTRLLLTTRGQSPQQQPVGGDLYVMTAEGSIEQLTEGGTSFGGSLSPLGAVAYIENQSLFVRDPAGGPPRVLATSEGGTWLGDPAWSPDGSQIAYVGYHELGRTWSISLVNVDGTGRHVIRDPDPLLVSGLVWSPDGSQLAFNGREWDETQDRSIEGVFVIDANGSEPRQLTNIGGVQTVHDCCSVAWSPDGTRIAFLRNRGLTDLITVAADGSDEQEIEDAFVTADGTIAWHRGG